jgi:hypothetical protein
VVSALEQGNVLAQHGADGEGEQRQPAKFTFRGNPWLKSPPALVVARRIAPPGWPCPAKGRQVFLIAESDTEPCILALKVHDVVSLLAILLPLAGISGHQTARERRLQRAEANQHTEDHSMSISA